MKAKLSGEMKALAQRAASGTVWPNRRVAKTPLGPSEAVRGPGSPWRASVLWALTWVQRAWKAHALQVVVATLFMFL